MFKCILSCSLSSIGEVMEENVLIDDAAIGLFEYRADELILSNNRDELIGFVSAIDKPFFFLMMTLLKQGISTR